MSMQILSSSNVDAKMLGASLAYWGIGHVTGIYLSVLRLGLESVLGRLRPVTGSFIYRVFGAPPPHHCVSYYTECAQTRA